MGAPPPYNNYTFYHIITDLRLILQIISRLHCFLQQHYMQLSHETKHQAAYNVSIYLQHVFKPLLQHRIKKDKQYFSSFNAVFTPLHTCFFNHLQVVCLLIYAERLVYFWRRNDPHSCCVQVASGELELGCQDYYFSRRNNRLEQWEKREQIRQNMCVFGVKWMYSRGKTPILMQCGEHSSRTGVTVAYNHVAVQQAVIFFLTRFRQATPSSQGLASSFHSQAVDHSGARAASQSQLTKWEYTSQSRCGVGGAFMNTGGKKTTQRQSCSRLAFPVSGRSRCLTSSLPSFLSTQKKQTKRLLFIHWPLRFYPFLHRCWSPVDLPQRAVERGQIELRGGFLCFFESEMSFCVFKMHLWTNIK